MSHAPSYTPRVTSPVPPILTSTPPMNDVDDRGLILQLGHGAPCRTPRTTRAVAHEFNNLLAVILGYAELILNDLEAPNSPLGDDLRDIREAGQRAKKLAQELLTSTDGASPVGPGR